MMRFTFEEEALIRCYPGENRKAVMEGINKALPYLEDTMRDLAVQTSDKIDKMIDLEFKELLGYKEYGIYDFVEYNKKNGQFERVEFEEKDRMNIIQNIMSRDSAQYQLQDERLRWCQALVNTDLKLYNEVSEQTLEILNLQHVEIMHGRVRNMDRPAEYIPANEAQEIDYDKMISAHQEELKKALEGGKKTLVINAFAGPGAGKTTVSLTTVAELKKMGYDAEYVSEYAKELVYENPALLDGSEKNQYLILKEQLRRMDRLIGKVDIIVTDSPILLNLIYGEKLSEDYKKMIPELYRQYDNFNFFVKRGVSFEQNGRMQNLEESIKKDEEIRNLLDKQGLYYGTYTHETSETLAKKIQITYNRIHGEKGKDTEQKPKHRAKGEKPLYQGIAYPKKTGKVKPDPVVVYGATPENCMSQVRIRNQSYEEKERMSSCYIRSYNPENNKYENPEKFDLNTGKNITTIDLKLPNLKKSDFMKLTQDIQKKGAKFDPIRKRFYITKADDFAPFKDYLPQEILEPEKGENKAKNEVSEEQIIAIGEKAGLAVPDLQTIITIGCNRGLTCSDIAVSLNAAIEKGTSKDEIFEILTEGLNKQIKAHIYSEPKRESVLNALHENKNKVEQQPAIDVQQKESIAR